MDAIATTQRTSGEPMLRQGDAPLAAVVAGILDHDGVHALLSWLNARVRYRFTGVYRVEPPMLRNLALFDRENPALALGGDINVLAETCCEIVAATGEGFVTGHAYVDPRLERHPARHGAVQSYLGVALRGPDGGVWGTLCHFDCRPRLASEGELAVLEAAARALAGRRETLSVRRAEP